MPDNNAERKSRNLYIDREVMDYYESNESDDLSFNEKVESALRFCIEQIEDDPNAIHRKMERNRLERRREWISEQISSLNTPAEEQ